MTIIDDFSNFWCTVEQPRFQANAAIKAFSKEYSKGCTPKIYQYPLSSIVPQFDHFDYRDIMYRDPVDIRPPEKLTATNSYKHLQIMFSPADGSEYSNTMLFVLATTSNISTSFYFEIIKVESVIHYQITVSAQYAEMLANALKSVLKNSTVEISSNDVLLTGLNYANEHNLFIRAYYPNPPYYRNLHSPNIKTTPNIFQLLTSLSKLSESEFFYYRVAIESSSDRWDRNCFNGYQYEKKVFGYYSDLNCEETWYVPPDAEAKKSISDKINPENMPIYFISPMIVLSCEQSKVSTIISFWNGYRFNDTPYKSINEDVILNTIGYEGFIDSLKNRFNHVQAHLLNRVEAASLMPTPCRYSLESPSINLSKGNISNEVFQTSKGLCLGYQNFGSNNIQIMLPQKHLENGLSLIGNPGYGKTNLLLNLLSQAFTLEPKYSMIVFYFHDFEFVADLISRVPDNRIDDVILAMPKLNGKVLARNLVDTVPHNDAAKKAAQLSYAFENSSTSFGIDIKRKFKNLLYCLMVCENTSLEHAFLILDKNDSKGQALRNHVKSITNNRQVLQFINDIEKRSESISVISNKLQEYFDDESVMEMFSFTGESILTYREVVENNKILIWYLGGLANAGDAVASTEVSLLHQFFNDYSRAESNSKKPYFPTITAIDEVQRIKAQGLAHSIREDRKYGLLYFLSTQTLKGVDPALIEGLNLITNMIQFQSTPDDAKYFASKCAGLLNPRALEMLGKYEAYVRVQSAVNITNFRTEKFISGSKEKLNRVINNSLARYYIEPNASSPSDIIAPKVKSAFKDKINSLINRR